MRIKGFKWIAAVVIALSLIVVWAYPKAYLAEVKEPVYNGSPMEFLGDTGLKQAKARGFVRNIDVSSEDKGIKITFKEVLCDNDTISIGFTQECQGGFKEFSGIWMDWYTDGLRIPGSSGGIITWKEIGVNRYAGVFSITVLPPAESLNNFQYGIAGMRDGFTGRMAKYFALSESGLPDEFKVKVELGEAGTVRGRWIFEFSASNKMAKAATKVINTAVIKKGENASITVSKVRFSPTRTQLWVDIWPQTQFYSGRFRLFDDKGKEIPPLGETALGPDPAFVPLENIPASVVLKPYNNSVLSVKEALNSDKFPITLSQGKLGEVTVKNVEFLKDKTRINFDFRPKQQGAKPEKIGIVNQSGLILGLESGTSGLGEPAVSLGGNAYVQEYLPIYNDGRLKLWTTAELEVEPIKELEVEIPLK